MQFQLRKLAQQLVAARGDAVVFLRSVADGGPDLAAELLLAELGRLPGSKDTQFSLEDCQGVELRLWQDKLVGWLLHSAVEMPMFVFSGRNQLRNLLEKMGCASGKGLTVPRTLLEQSIFSSQGLSICFDSPEVIQHEALHRIDPNLGQRKGLNRIIDEAFAHFPVVATDLDGMFLLANALAQPQYFVDMCSSGETYANFRGACGAVASSVYILCDKKGDRYALETLMRCLTLVQLHAEARSVVFD